MIYLSSTTNIPDEFRDCFGIMFSAKYRVGGLEDALQNKWQWMMDNNQFAGDFDTKTWITALLKNLPYQSQCLGIPIPDKVGDALQTLRQFSQYWRIVKDLGYPVAFVSQDGITPEITPWDNFDVLFVGGTDDHKLGPEAGVMIAEAKARGKWVHVGRVNSAERIKKFWMADSVDGTDLTRIRTRSNGDKRSDLLTEEIDRLACAVQYCCNRKTGNLTLTNQYTIGV